MKTTLCISALLLTGALTVHAGEIQELTVFQAGTVAKASEVNGNFSAVTTAVNDNNAQVVALTALVNELTARIEALETEQADRQAAINFADDLREVASIHTRLGQLSVTFSGVNVYIDNGSGKSAVADGGENNGRGNLFIGYNEFLSGNQKTGSHNLVIGPQHSFTSELGIVAGRKNVLAGRDSVVVGELNIAGGTNSVAVGGRLNNAQSTQAAIIGGSNNTASGQSSTVFGGESSTASGQNALVLGGRTSTAAGLNSAVIGSTNSLADAVQAGVILSNSAVVRAEQAVIASDNNSSLLETECRLAWLVNFDNLLDTGVCDPARD